MTTAFSNAHPRRRWLLLPTAILLACGVAAWGADDLLTPHDVARLRSVAEAVISPDGARVAYALRVPRDLRREPDGAFWRELIVVGPEGSPRTFVTGRVSVSRIAWTPDGNEIAFLAQREGEKTVALYVIPAGGGEAHRLFQFDTDIREFAFSPDGHRVAFLAQEAVSEIKAKREAKGFRPQIFEEDWHPVHVWVAERGSSAGKPRRLDLPGSASELHWSPTANRLAVALAPTSLEDDHLQRRKLHVVDADSGAVLARLDNPGRLGAARWSPDSAHLGLLSVSDPSDPLPGRLVVAPAAGGPLRDLLPGYEGHVSAIAWQDADTLMFLGDEGVWMTFNRVDVDGSNRRTILPAEGAILLGFSLAADGMSAAFLGQTPTHPTEVFFMKHGDSAPRRITDSNPWLAGVRLARQEVIEFQAADGIRLEGILIRPLDEVEGKRYPLLLVVHGGPEAHYRNGWLTYYPLPGQVGAGRGFAVFYPNYRGSTGRGVVFSKLNQGDPAGKEFDDLMDGVEHLIETGLVDPDRVGITGISYGGYATAWAATYYSEHIAAAVMFAGVSDLTSCFGTTDLPASWYEFNLRTYPWEDWEFFLERSPIRYVEDAHTPLLILHGEEDASPGQALELYRFLKLAGKAPVRLVLYPGEGHGLDRAAARLDYNLRMLEWFEHYLKGPGGEPPPYELDYGLEEPAAKPAAKPSEARP